MSHPHRYLNDIFTLEIREGTSLQWVSPTIEGPCPSPRESHSAVTMGNKLVVYGGMNGHRLGDLWILNVGTLAGYYHGNISMCWHSRCYAVEHAYTNRGFPVTTELTHCMYDQEQVSQEVHHMMSMWTHDLLQDVHIWRLGASQSRSSWFRTKHGNWVEMYQ